VNHEAKPERFACFCCGAERWISGDCECFGGGFFADIEIIEFDFRRKFSAAHRSSARAGSLSAISPETRRMPTGFWLITDAKSFPSRWIS
jgi:hypothetical protein